MDVTAINFPNVNWIYLLLDVAQWIDFVNMGFLVRCDTVSTGKRLRKFRRSLLLYIQCTGRLRRLILTKAYFFINVSEAS